MRSSVTSAQSHTPPSHSHHSSTLHDFHLERMAHPHTVHLAQTSHPSTTTLPLHTPHPPPPSPHTLQVTVTQNTPHQAEANRHNVPFATKPFPPTRTSQHRTSGQPLFRLFGNPFIGNNVPSGFPISTDPDQPLRIPYWVPPLQYTHPTSRKFEPLPLDAPPSFPSRQLSRSAHLPGRSQPPTSYLPSSSHCLNTHLVTPSSLNVSNRTLAEGLAGSYHSPSPSPPPSPRGLQPVHTHHSSTLATMRALAKAHGPTAIAICPSTHLIRTSPPSSPNISIEPGPNYSHHTKQRTR